jgi:hypothetical protein
MVISDLLDKIPDLVVVLQEVLVTDALTILDRSMSDHLIQTVWPAIRRIVSNFQVSLHHIGQWNAMETAVVTKVLDNLFHGLGPILGVNDVGRSVNILVLQTTITKGTHSRNGVHRDVSWSRISQSVVAIVQPKDTKLEVGFSSGRDLLPECGLTTCVDTTGVANGLAEVGHFTIAEMMSIARHSVNLNISNVGSHVVHKTNMGESSAHRSSSGSHVEKVGLVRSGRGLEA